MDASDRRGVPRRTSSGGRPIDRRSFDGAGRPAQRPAQPQAAHPQPPQAQMSPEPSNDELRAARDSLPGVELEHAPAPRQIQRWRKRKVHIGRWTMRLGTLSIALVLFLTLSMGAVYARFGGGPRNNAATSSDADLQKGLLGYWKLDGNAKDSTPYAHNGTVSGLTSTTDRKGIANHAYQNPGSGTSPRITLSSMPALTTFSMSFWVNFQNPGSGNWNVYMSSPNYGSTGANSWQINSNATNNQVNMVVRDAAAASSTISCSSLTTGAWTLITATYDNATLAMKANASSTNCTSTSKAGLTPEAMNGMIAGSGTSPAVFSMDDIRLYDRALNTNEVSAVYKQYDTQTNLGSGEKGLVGWWKMDGNAKDSSPYANNATVTGASLTTDRKGMSNKAYQLDGTSNTIRVSSSPFPTSVITVSAWVNLASLPSTFTNFMNNAWTSQNGSWLLYVSNTGRLQFGLYQSSTQYNAQCSVGSLPASGWHYISGTYDGTTVTAYVDGVACSTTASVSGVTLYTGGTTTIAALGAGGAQYNIDDVRIYKRVLSTSEMQQQYKSYSSQISLGGSDGTVNLGKGLAGYWPLNGNAKDATPYANNGTIGGGTLPSLTTDRKGRANSAYSFNGTQSYIRPGITGLPTTAITVNAWVNISTLVSWYDLINNRWANAGAFDLYTSGTGGVTFGVYDTAQRNANCPASSITAGSWYMLTGTYDGTTVRTYVNGVSCASTAVSGVTLSYSAGNLQFGETNAGSSTHTIDDVRIYNRALSSTEITALYRTYN